MSKIKLCLDPGHGMGNVKSGQFDTGAVSGSFRESDIALTWADSGQFLLPPLGIDVFMTRKDNSSPDPVGRRDDKAAAARCTHFISIHLNCFNGKASGCEAFYRDSADKQLADIVLGCVVEATGLASRGVKREGESQHSRLAVLDFGPPACLVEIGFIDNPTDRAKLLDRNVRIRFYELLSQRLKAAYGA